MYDKAQRTGEKPGSGTAALPPLVAPGPAAMANPPDPPEDLPLPPANVGRWTIRRKAAVVIAIGNGLLTAADACRRYQLTEEELRGWQTAYGAHGLPGLRSTRLQQYRSRPPRE
jgi:hypothetical protein